MKHSPLYPATLVLAAVLAGCAQDAPTSVAAEGGPLMAKPGTTGSVSLSVTIADVCPTTADDTSSPCRIRSDKPEAYTNGVDNVKAVLDSYGNFIFDSNNSRGSAIRSVIHDFGARYGTAGTTEGAPEPDRTRNVHMSMVKSQLTTGKVHLQSMDPGSVQCVAFSNGYFLKSNPKLTGKVSFHRAWEDNLQSPTAYGVVRRVDADTWTITPGKGETCPNVSEDNRAQTVDVAAVRNDDGTVLYGYYHLPFIFTLKRK